VPNNNDMEKPFDLQRDHWNCVFLKSYHIPDGGLWCICDDL